MNGGFFHGKDDKYKKKFRKNPPAGAVIPKEDTETGHSYLPKPKRRALRTKQRTEVRNQKDITGLRKS